MVGELGHPFAAPIGIQPLDSVDDARMQAAPSFAYEAVICRLPDDVVAES